MLDFGALEEGGSETRTITLANGGDATLQLLYVGTSGSDAFSLSPLVWEQIAPGKSLVLEVAYTPHDAADRGLLSVVTDDPVVPEAQVELLGGLALPALQISPSPLILSTTTAGVTTEGELELINVGEAELVIEGLALSGEAFALVSGEAPLFLAPGASETLRVSFSPDAKGTYTGRVWTADNTPARTNSASLLGAAAVPVAQCSVTPTQVAPLRESADWLGEESFDASGAGITGYRWRLLERPAGSVATLPEGSGPNRLGFVPDLAGQYVAELIVTNAAGEESAPCYAALKAVPDEHLWIELFWSHPNDDLDLHLLRPDGALRTDSDCYYDNCVGGGLDWGTLGQTADDPSLDIDDIYGTGPENINIALPEAGTFSVVVHDYSGSTPDYYGDNEATVNIFLAGELAWTGSRTIRNDGSFTWFAEVSWPSGAIVPLE